MLKRKSSRNQNSQQIVASDKLPLDFHEVVIRQPKRIKSETNLIGPVRSV